MEGLWILVVLFGCIALVAIIGILASVWPQVRQAEIDARLKQDMLARGLSAEDIARLVQVKPGTVAVRPPPQGRPSSASLSLAAAIDSMVQAGKDTDEIAALLDAFQQPGEGPQASASERPGSASRGLAAALESMAQTEKTVDELAAFLDAFLQRNDGPQQTAREPSLLPERPGIALRSADIQRFGGGREG